MRYLLIGFLLVQHALCAAAAFASTASFTPLGTLFPGVSPSEGLAISGDGTLVLGKSLVPAGSFVPFRWDAVNGIVHLGVGEVHTAISEDGTFGVARVSGGAVRTEVATATQLAFGPPLAASWDWMLPHDISADGTVSVGEARIDDTVLDTAWLWDAQVGTVELNTTIPFTGTLEDLQYAVGVSDDGLRVTGRGVFGSSNLSFVWDAPGSVQWLDPSPLGTHIRAEGISGDGAVVVGRIWTPTSSPYEAFLWTDAGGIVPLGTLGSGFAMATASSQDGSLIFGNSVSSTLLHQPFIWDAANGMRNLTDVLTSQGVVIPSHYRLETVADVSHDGSTVTGNAWNSNLGTYEAYVAVIPEPGVALQLWSGIALIVGLGRARKR